MLVVRRSASCAALVLTTFLAVSCREQAKSTVEAAYASKEQSTSVTVPPPPEGSDPDALLKYLGEVASNSPKERTPENMRQYCHNVLFAGESVLKLDVDDERVVALAASFQTEALEGLAQQGDETASKRLETLLETLAKDKRPGVVGFVEFYRLNDQLEKFETLTPAGKKAVVLSLAEKLSAPSLMPDYVLLAMAVGNLYEDVPEEAKSALTMLAERLEARNDVDPQIVMLIRQYAPMLRSKAKQLELIGRPAELQGPLLDGKPFDLASLKGKVILIDFWATWCGPCRQELPHVMSYYKAYHDKGFEVVGLSLDDDIDTVKTFVEDQKIPWGNIFETDPDRQEWSNPVVKKYAVTSLPACILVDQDGKIVSVNARGGRLGKLLKKMLGPADVAGEESETK